MLPIWLEFTHASTRQMHNLLLFKHLVCWPLYRNLPSHRKRHRRVAAGRSAPPSEQCRGAGPRRRGGARTGAGQCALKDPRPGTLAWCHSGGSWAWTRGAIGGRSSDGSCACDCRGKKERHMLPWFVLFFFLHQFFFHQFQNSFCLTYNTALKEREWTARPERDAQT